MSDVPVNGQKDHSLKGSEELRLLAQAINALARVGDMGERLAKLEQWKDMIHRPRGYLTGLENRVKTLEDWKEGEGQKTATNTRWKREWLLGIGLLVAGSVLTLLGGWALQKITGN